MNTGNMETAADAKRTAKMETMTDAQENKKETQKRANITPLRPHEHNPYPHLVATLTPVQQTLCMVEDRRTLTTYRSGFLREKSQVESNWSCRRR